MGISMTSDGRACGDAAAALARFRQELYFCLRKRADALFELCDALLSARRGGPLPYLSLEPVFRRGHGMIYQALDAGRAAEEPLRDLLAAARPRDWPLVFAIDASAYPRPEAETSPGRSFQHTAGPRGADRMVAGWGFQWLAQLNFSPDSWTAPQDMTRVESGRGTPEAAGQIRAHAARLRAGGETRVPLYAHDGGYGEAELTWDLRAELAAGQVQVLVRVRNDRRMYRDPPPRPPGSGPGRPRRHGDLFSCKDPATWGTPDAGLTCTDGRYGQVSVTSWGGLHPELERKGAFAGHQGELPILKGTLIRIQVSRLPGGKKNPSPIWLWHAGPPGTAPDLDLCWRAYLHRYDIEHTFRFAKQALGWARALVRTPVQAARWTWLVIAALTQLRLARPIARDHKLPWEKPAAPGQLTPGRVRRDFPRLAAAAGTPARPPKTTKPGTGRPRGRKSTPAPRHPVQRKGTTRT